MTALGCVDDLSIAVSGVLSQPGLDQAKAGTVREGRDIDAR